jgi:hypothetical protein
MILALVVFCGKTLGAGDEGTVSRVQALEIALTCLLPEMGEVAIFRLLTVSHIGQFKLIAD